MKFLFAIIASVLMLAAVSTAQAQPFAYITNNNSNDISVINTATNTVAATVAVGTNPLGIAVNPAGTRAYVGNQGSNNVSVIDTATNTVVATVAVGASPNGIAVNPAGTRAYVANNSSNNVSVIDTATNTVVATVAVGPSPLGVAVNPAGTRAYVTNVVTNDVSVIDTATNTVVATVVVGFSPFGVAANPAGTRVYVGNQGSNNVSVIDTATNTVVATVAVGFSPYGVAVNPAGTRVYVGTIGVGNVSVIDTATNTVVATVVVGANPIGIAVNPAGTRAYVANAGGNNVSVIDTATNLVVATVAVGATPAAHGLFIGTPPAATVPGAPTAATAVAGDSQATVSYTAPAPNGGSTILSYTATSNPGGIQGFTTGGPIIVNGLTNGTAYTFTVTATNAVGVGPPSAASNSVTPAAALVACQFIPVSGAWIVPANWSNCAGGNGVPAGTPGTANRADILGKTAILPTGTLNVGDINLSGLAVIQGTGLATSTLNVVAAGATAWGTGSYTFQNMTVVFTSLSTINAASGPLTVTNSLMILTAPLTTLLADSITITGTGAKIRNSGIFNPSTFLNMTAGGEFQNDGSFTPVSPITINGTFINQGAFLTTAGVPVTLTNAAAFSQPVAAGFLGGNGNIVATGQTLTVASGFIEGNIIIAAGLLNNTGAVVSPGGVGISGSIQIVGDYAASAAAGLDIEIAGGISGPVVDRLVVSGTGTFTNATVNFFYINTGQGVYVPSPGDSQNFVTASVALAGFFTTFTHPPGPNVISLNFVPPGIVQFVVTAPSAVTLNTNPIILAPTPIGWTRALFVTASNSSASPVTFSPPTIAGAPVFNVSVNQVPSCITGTIPALGSCDFIFNFTPTALGPFTGTFTLLTSGGNFSVPVGGSGIATIAFPAVTPTTFNFPPTAVGAFSTPLVMVFSTPVGGATVQFQGFPISGTDATDFVLLTDNCNSQFVAPGSNCTVQTKFAPLTTGAKSANLTYLAVEPSGSFRGLTVSFTATAVVAAPAITVTGTTTFPTTAIGSSSTVQFITINNSGSANLNLASITNSNVAVFKDTVNGPPPQAAQYCGFGSDATGAPLVGGPIVIAPGAICNLVMVFSPNAAGPLSATITVTSNALTSPTIITLTGTGATAPTATLTPGPLNFGSVTVGSTSAPLTATFANPSALPLQISAINVGPGFTVTGGTCVIGNIIASGGGNCTITATASPTAVGALSSALQVFTSPLSNNPSVVVTVNGTAAVLAPVITSATTASGSVGTPLSYQIIATNSPTLYGINSLPAGVSINTATGLISGTPTAAGVGTVTITATNASGTGTQSLTFTILAAVAPGVTLSVPSVAFGTRAVATTSPPSTVTLGNSGTALLTIASITSTGNFGFTTSCPISPATLAIGIACPINITFTPLTATLLTGAITIVSNAPGSPHTITLSGTGSGVAVPGISLAPATLAFGAQTVNTVSPLQSVVVTNTGFANLVFAGIAVGAPFSRVPLGAVVPPDCGSSLAPSSSCQIAVSVSPTAVGAVTGFISIADNATGSPHTVALSVTGTAVPVPVISTSGAIAFGDQVINSTSGGRALTISNTGTAVLTISAITLTGTNAANFAMTGQSACASILPASSCTLNLTFAPTTTGAKTAQINITSNTQIVATANANTPTIVSLAGNGVLAPRPIVTVTSTAIGFGDVIFGGATPYQTVTLTNAGGQVMSITSIVAIGDFVPVNNCPASLASLASCTISIIFTPLLQGNRSGEIAITTSATTSPDRVQLSGRGCRWFNPAQSRFFLTSCG